MASYKWNGIRQVVYHNRNMKTQQTVREKTIKQRGHKCEKCGYTGYIELHHIIEVSKGGTFDNDNLMLLCEKCHAEEHGHNKKKYIDPNRKQWQRNTT